MRPLSVLAGLLAGAVVLVRRRRRAAAERVRFAAAHPLRPEAIVSSDAPDDVFVVLGGEHDELREVVSGLGGPAEADGETREKLRRIVTLSTRHEATEELELWPVVRRTLDGGDVLAARAAAEELELRRLLHTVERRRPGTPGFSDLVQELRTAVSEHLVFEEVHVWPPLSRALAAKERAAVGRRVVRARRTAPIRPHVSTLAEPGTHPRLARAILGYDRLADRMGQRDR